MASLRNEFSLERFLEWLEHRVGLSSPLMDELRTLWLKVKFLQVFLSCGINNIENRRLQALLLHITTVFQTVDLDIRRCRADFKFSSEEDSEAFDPEWEDLDTEGWWFPMNLVDLLPSAQQKLELLQPHIHEVYTILSKSSSRSTLHGDSEAAMFDLKFLQWCISHLFENNAQMVAPVKEELEAAQEKLRFLSGLLGFTRKRCSKLGKLKDLIIHAEFLADKMSCLLCMCSFNEKMNEQMKMNLSSELNNFSPAQPHVRQIYIKALKASKLAKGHSAVEDESDWNFLCSLKDNILQLPGTKLSFVASNKDQILSLHKELPFLAIALATSESSETGGVCNNFLERSNAAIIEMECLIFSLHNNEQPTDEAKELKRAVSDLQDFIKIAKEDARKAYDTVIMPQSSRGKTKFRTTNAQGMMDFLMNISGQIAGQYSYMFWPLQPSEVLQEEMQSLIGTFSNLTAKQQFEYGELEIQMTRLNDIRNEAKSLMSSLLFGSRPSWEKKLWFFVFIEEIKLIKGEFKYLQNQIMHDTSKSVPHSRTNPQGKETMIDYAEISEDEPKRTGKQLINGSKKPYSLLVTVGMHGIEDHHSNLDLICPQKDEVKALSLRAVFLKIFLSCKGTWHIEDGNLNVPLTHIHNVFLSVDEDLRRLWLGLNIQTSPKEVWCLPMNMDCLLSRVLSRLQLLERDIQEAFAILSRSSIFITGISDEALMEILNTLLMNIEVLLKSNIELVAPLKKELGSVQKSLRFLRNFLGFITKRYSKLWKLKDLLIHSEFLAGNISCLLYLCCNNEKINDHMVNEMKMHLQYELQRFSPTQPSVREIYIKALKSSKSAKGNSVVLDESVLGFLDSLRDDMLELSDNNLSFIAFDKEQILSLQEELKFLITFFTMDRSLEEHSLHDEVSTSLFEHINDVIIDFGCVIYLLNDDGNNEMLIRELNKKVSDIRKIYDFHVPSSLRSDFPRTNGQGFIGSLFRNLNELLNTNPDSVAPLKSHIEIVQNELLSLKQDFGETTEQPNQCDELHNQWTHFLDLAYQTEFIIDSFLAGGDSIYCNKLGLFNVLEEIKAINIKLKAIKKKMSDATLVQKPSQMSIESNFPGNNAVLSSKERPTNEKSTRKLVIFGEEEKKIREQLIAEGPKDLIILSIVGMPGIGKTTLADTMFQHSSVTNHFHVRARYSVSQVFDKKRLLLEILQQIRAKSKRGDDNGDLEQRLKQSLMGRRYLILLDDIWYIEHWNDIKACFPNDANGSRIIFTSRFEDITSHETGLESIIHHLSPLSEETCWKMLKKKLFGDEKCRPKELKMVGREIAANCKGLPLMVDLVAGGVLQVKEIENWKKVSKSLVTSLLEGPQGHCWKVLELSYQNLPDDFKPCFLYFAAFPEDANVPTRNLILLWIAEGFVKLENNETRSLEDVAKDILNSLITRNLVTVSQRGPLGGVVESRVHDLLHEFVVAKAQDENFMLKIDDKAMFSTSSSLVVHKWQEQYRLCIYPNYQWQLPELHLSGPRTRALIGSKVPWDNFFLNFRTFKLIRVLDCRGFSCPYFPEMFTLVHLTLLAISGPRNSDARDIISNIHKLRNLETFITDGYREFDENLLLDKICNMERLRHFLVGDNYIGIRYLREEIWQKACFANLQTLYTLKASYEEDIEKILKLMPNLVELKVLFYNLDGGCYPFPELNFLNKLESLEVTHENCRCGPSYPCKIISFPPHLKRLVLSNFGVPWTQISEIGNHESLEVLELERKAFIGPKWDMIDGQFPKLKYLSLYELDITEWNASGDHLSCLEKLRVDSCYFLKDLPSCLAEIATLQAIQLSGCTKVVKDSATRIKEEQEQMGNGQLVVDISKMVAVLKVGIYDDNVKRKVMEEVSRHPGVDSISIDMKGEKLTVTGCNIDLIFMTCKLRKLCRTDLLSAAKVFTPKV